MPDHWDAEARKIIVVEPDGKAWRVSLVGGANRHALCRYGGRDACEAFARNFRRRFIVPLARRAEREGMERAAKIADAWETGVGDVIRREIEAP